MHRQPALGRQVKERRSARGLRQADLAGGKVSVAYVSLIEAGKRAPTNEVLVHLADRLGCSTSELLGGPSPAQVERWREALEYADLALHNGSADGALSAMNAVLEEAATLEVDQVDPHLLWRTRWIRARALESTGDLDAAIAEMSTLYALAADPAGPGGDPERAIEVAMVWSKCLSQQGDMARAFVVVDTARNAAEAAGLQRSERYVELTSVLMLRLYMRNEIDRAAAVAADLLPIVEAGGSSRSRALAYSHVAAVAEAQGRLSEAVTMAERAVALLSEESDLRMLARAQIACAWFILRSRPQRASEALELLMRADQALQAWGSPADRAHALTEVGRAHLLMGRPDRALETLTEALDCMDGKTLATTSETWLVKARAHLALGEPDRAEESTTTAEACLRNQSVNRFSAMGWRELGQVHEERGDPASALTAYKAALDASVITGTFGAAPSDLDLGRSPASRS